MRMYDVGDWLCSPFFLQKMKTADIQPAGHGEIHFGNLIKKADSQSFNHKSASSRDGIDMIEITGPKDGLRDLFG